MRFSANGLYIESYTKCPNCGVLLYENSAEDRAHIVHHSGKKYCSQRCITWEAARERRRASAAAGSPMS
jgi:hypothetical protein